MIDPEGVRRDLTQVLERFPDDATLVRRLFVASKTFQSICEDYALARATFDHLKGSPEQKQHAHELADYLALVADLEREIVQALRYAKRA